MIPTRGRIYRADIGYGLKPFLIVSNNARNRNLDDVLAVRLTTTVKPEIASIVVLGRDDPMGGRVLCDAITVLYRDEIGDDLGALSRASMTAVNQALKVALSLT